MTAYTRCRHRLTGGKSAVKRIRAWLERWLASGTYDIVAPHLIIVWGLKMPSNNSKALEVGAVFGRLEVKGLSHKDKKWRRFYLCRCECGNEKIIHGAALSSGNTKSCGCLAKESLRKRALPGSRGAINQLILGYKRHAKDRGLEWNLSDDDVIEITSNPCAYCGVPPSNIKKGYEDGANFTYSGIDRVKSEAGYIKENCVPACKICNFAKSDMTLEQFADWAKRIGAFAAQWSI